MVGFASRTMSIIAERYPAPRDHEASTWTDAGRVVNGYDGGDKESDKLTLSSFVISTEIFWFEEQVACWWHCGELRRVSPNGDEQEAWHRRRSEVSAIFQVEMTMSVVRQNYL